jgi:hypothetical protein
MIALPKTPVDLVGAYDDAADVIQRREVVLGLALELANARARRAVLEICLIASVMVNGAAVAAIAGLILYR